MPTFELKHLADYSHQAIIEEIRRVAELAGSGGLTLARFKKDSRVSPNTLRRRFGSWPGALKAAGVEHVYVPRPGARKSRTAARALSRDDVVQELRRVAALVAPETLTVESFNSHSFIGADAVRARFGRWRDAVRAAGHDVGAHGRRYTDEECFQNLLAVWTHYGRAPQHREMGQLPSTVGPKPYVKRWGSWRKALAAFAARVEGGEGDAAATPSPPPAPGTRAKVRPEDRHEIALSLRYRVLKRDNFRCVLCGRSPATEHGCELQVDHIIPFSKGGKTVEENLRTLCDKCNQGRSNRE